MQQKIKKSRLTDNNYNSNNKTEINREPERKLGG